MFDVVLGDKRNDDKDATVVVYDTIEVKGVPNPDYIVRNGFASKIMGFLDGKFSGNEKFASMVDDSQINFNEHRQTITLSLEFKGADVSESDIKSAIIQAIES